MKVACNGSFLKLKVSILSYRIRQQLTVEFVSETLQTPLVQQLEVISQADPPTREKLKRSACAVDKWGENGKITNSKTVLQIMAFIKHSVSSFYQA